MKKPTTKNPNQPQDPAVVAADKKLIDTITDACKPVWERFDCRPRGAGDSDFGDYNDAMEKATGQAIGPVSLCRAYELHTFLRDTVNGESAAPEDTLPSEAVWAGMIWLETTLAEQPANRQFPETISQLEYLIEQGERQGLRDDDLPAAFDAIKGDFVALRDHYQGASSDPVVVAADDSELLARVADFWKAHKDDKRKGEISHACYKKMKTMQDFPGYPTPDMGTPERERYDAEHSRCADASGYHPAFDLWNEAGKDMGAAANAVFAIPAQTVRGAVEKLKIAYLATGDGEGTATGDDGLETYQDLKAPWMANVLADLERLATTERPPVVPALVPDPAVIAAREAEAGEAAYNALPSDLESEDPPAFEEAQKRLSVTDGRFADAEPTTLAGAIAKLRTYIMLEDEPPEAYLGCRHVRTVLAYLEKATGDSIPSFSP